MFLRCSVQLDFLKERYIRTRAIANLGQGIRDRLQFPLQLGGTIVIWLEVIVFRDPVEIEEVLNVVGHDGELTRLA